MPQNNGTLNGVLFTQTADVTVANTAAETPLNGTGVGSLALPVNFLQIGKTVRVRARGYISDTGTPNFTAKIKFGSTVIMSTGTVAFAGTISNNQWVIEGVITCRTTGASGTVAAQGSFYEDPDNRRGMTNTATVTVDTTATQAITVTFQWGAADPANTITCTNLTVDAVGPARA